MKLSQKAKRRKAIVSAIEGLIGITLIFGFLFALIAVAEIACTALGVGA